MKQQKDIFISYRRAGGEWFAYCIYLELLAAGYTVFFDVASLRGGDFEKDIEEQILSCKDFILVLPPDALKRCVEADDLVYKEIKTAKDAGKNIIPIMMKGFSIPSQNIFIENNCSERYQDMKYIEGRNGYITDGILNLDGTILHLKKNLLTAIPNIVTKQKKSIFLENVFAGRDTAKKIRKPEYELLPNLSTNEYFVEGSRDKEIAWLSDAIERLQPVFVWGYGGVGKTEMVLEFARYHSRHRNVAFVTFSNSIRETIIQMKFVGYSMPDLEQLSKEEREVAEEKIYQEKLRLLNAYSEEDILIVDNFEKAGKTLVELKRESAYKDLVSIRMHVIFTTRNRPDKYTKEIQSLTNEDLLIMMKHYLGSTYVSEDLLFQLIDAVDSHTMAVELIAKLIADEFSNITPQKILKAFAGGNVKELNDAEIDSYKDREYKETTIFEYIKKLFDMAALSENEMEVLLHTFFISSSGMDVEVFTKIGKDHYSFPYDKVLKSLVNKGWLRIKEGNIFIHPLVKEVMREGEKIEFLSCDYLMNFYAPQYNPNWFLDDKNLTYAEKDIALKKGEKAERMRAEYLVNVFRYFNEENPFYVAAAAENYRRCGDFEQSVMCSHCALDIMVQKKNNGDSISDIDCIETLSVLHNMWCPKMIETSWDPDYYYGNELYEEHLDKPDDIQDIYRKMQFLHNIPSINRKKRYVEISEDGTVLKKFNYFQDTDYEIPNGIVRIESKAFEKCIHLKNVVMPNSVEWIGEDLFLGCKNLESVRLSENIKELPYGTFCGCENLESIIMPDSVEVIGEDAFLACEKLKKIKMSENLHKIKDEAFENCLSLEEIIFPERLVSLGSEVFKGCDKLEQIFIPQNVKEIDSLAFKGSGIKKVVVDEENKWFCSAWNSLFTKDRKILLRGQMLSPDFEVFDETEEIGEFACQANLEINEIEFSDNIRKIGRNAFAGCKNLKVIKGTECLEVIGDYSFYGCLSLKRVGALNSLTELGEAAFMNCNKMENIVLPECLGQLGENVFQRCCSLKELVLPQNIKKVPSELCADCYNLKEVVLAKGTTEIHNNAFANCVHLTKIHNTGEVILVEGEIFRNCVDLDIPVFSSGCKNVRRYSGLELTITKNNCNELMLGYKENDMYEWQKREIESIMHFAKKFEF